MGPQDPRVDTYIEAAAAFARPLLIELRRRVHGSGLAIDESIKWSHPAFLHDGRIVAFMAAFKAHVGFGFWKPKGADDGDGMGQFGRLTDLSMLPGQDRVDAGLHDAIARHAAPAARGAPAPRAARTPLETPQALRVALEAHPAAKAAYEAFAPSHRREYAEWIAEAKREETRARRVAQAVEWLAEGRPRNWKYMSRG